jgi:hypothetical protein
LSPFVATSGIYLVPQCAAMFRLLPLRLKPSLGVSSASEAGDLDSIPRARTIFRHLRKVFSVGPAKEDLSCRRQTTFGDLLKAIALANTVGPPTPAGCDFGLR